MKTAGYSDAQIMGILKSFEFLQLLGSHPTILLTPALKCLRRYLYLPDRIDARHSLPTQHLNLP